MVSLCGCMAEKMGEITLFHAVKLIIDIKQSGERDQERTKQEKEYC